MASLHFQVEVYDREKAVKEHGWGKAAFSFFGATEEQRATLVKVMQIAIRKLEGLDIHDATQTGVGRTDLERRWQESENSSDKLD